MSPLVEIHGPGAAPGLKPALGALVNGHLSGQNAKSSLTLLGLLLFWATRNAR